MSPPFPSWVLKMVENLWAVGDPSRTPLWELTYSAPQTPYLVGRSLLPKNFSPLSTFGLDFRPVDLNCPSKQCKILGNPLIAYLWFFTTMALYKYRPTYLLNVWPVIGLFFHVIQPLTSRFFSMPIAFDASLQYCWCPVLWHFQVWNVQNTVTSVLSHLRTVMLNKARTTRPSLRDRPHVDFLNKNTWRQYEKHITEFFFIPALECLTHY